LLFKSHEKFTKADEEEECGIKSCLVYYLLLFPKLK
jgi:hypothetical protein